MSRHGRFRIRPEEGTEYLSDEEAAASPPNFLFDEIGPRLAKGPGPAGRLRADGGAGDDVTNASVTWPEDRPEIPFGTITLTARVDDRSRRGGRSSSTPSRGSMASTRPGTP